MQSVNDTQQTESTCPTAGGFNFLWTAFTLVPDALLNEENEDLWINFLRDRIPRDQHIARCPIPGQGCTCLYELKKEPASHIIPELIHASLERTNTDGNAIVAIRQADKLAVAVVQNGRLQLANIYESGTKEQTLYWLLSIYEELRLPKDTTIYIRCGVSTMRLINAHLIVEAY